MLLDIPRHFADSRVKKLSLNGLIAIVAITAAVGVCLGLAGLKWPILSPAVFGSVDQWTAAVATLAAVLGLKFELDREKAKAASTHRQAIADAALDWNPHPEQDSQSTDLSKLRLELALQRAGHPTRAEQFALVEHPGPHWPASTKIFFVHWMG